MRKRRTYNTRLIKKTCSYSVQQVAALFNLHKNAVRRWIKEGLEPIDRQKPYLIRGNVLIRFLSARQKAKKRPCAPDEFYCVKCRAPRRAHEGIAQIAMTRPGLCRVKARCAVCSTPVNKAQSVQKLPELQKIFTLQTLA